MDRGAWRAELDPAERLSVLGRKSIGAFPVSQRLAHLFLIHETAAPKRTWGCAQGEETPQQRHLPPLLTRQGYTPSLHIG